MWKILKLAPQDRIMHIKKKSTKFFVWKNNADFVGRVDKVLE